MALDEVDKDILGILRKRGRISYTELSDELGISDVAVKKRISNLEDRGVIQNFTVDIDYSELGKSLQAFLLIKLSPEAKSELRKELEDMDKVLNHYNTIGEFDLIIETACEDLDELKDFSERKIGNLRSVQEIRTAIITDRGV